MANSFMYLGLSSGAHFDNVALVLDAGRPISFGLVALGVIIVGAALIILVRKLN